jgi:hypothetical protein
MRPAGSYAQAARTSDRSSGRLATPTAWLPLTAPLLPLHRRTPLGTLSLGRRKSWIVPIQTIVGVMLWFLGSNVDRLLLAVSKSALA